MAETFRQVPAAQSAVRRLRLLAALLAVLALAVALPFALYPEDSMWVTGIVTACVLLSLGMAALFAYAAHSAHHGRFEVSPEDLRIRNGALYGRAISLEKLRLGGAQITNLDGALWPTLRTNGLSVPGYQAGWFWLRNRENALLFVTEKERVLHIPTTEGYALILSAERPEALLAALRRHAKRAASEQRPVAA